MLQAGHGYKCIGQDHMCTITYLLPLHPFLLCAEVSLLVIFGHEKHVMVTTFLIV